MVANRIVVLVLSGWLSLTAAAFGQPHDRRSDVRAGEARELSDAVRAATERVLPSVVAIKTLSGPRVTAQWAQREAEAFALRRFPHPAASGPQSRPEFARGGSASGIVFDQRGYILTCEHVVAQAEVLKVVLPDGREFEPTEVWADPLTDLAVLHIEGAGPLPAATFATSESSRVGDWVASCGHPYGLGPSASIGIISATDRVLDDTPGTVLIQTDAASNPGSSGGALVNLQGEVIGITEGGVGAGRGFQGIALAVPSSTALQVARELIEHGHIRRGYLGCEVETVSPAVAQHLGLAAGLGVIVGEVEPQSAAAIAGIEVGDVLTHVAGEPVRDAFRFGRLIQSSAPGRPCPISIARGGRTIVREVLLNQLVLRDGERPTHSEDSTPAPVGHRDEQYGLVLDELTPAAARELGFAPDTRGVLVTHVEPGMPAYHEDVCAGMVILTVEGTSTPHLAEYEAARRAITPDQATLLLIAAPEGKHFVVLGRNSP